MREGREGKDTQEGSCPADDFKKPLFTHRTASKGGSSFVFVPTIPRLTKSDVGGIGFQISKILSRSNLQNNNSRHLTT